MDRMIAAAIGAAFVVTANIAAAAELNPLITPSELAALDGVKIIDIRDPKAFATGHVEGAVNAPYPAWRGPETNPGEPLTDEALTTVLQSAGLEPDDSVVVTYAGVDETDFGAAARVYWTLKSAGFEEIAILNGGVTEWVEEERPLKTGAVQPTPTTARYTLSDDWSIDREGVLAVQAGERDATLVDARPHTFFRAETKHPAAMVAGTLQVATNLPFAAWFGTSSNRITSPEEATRIAKEAAAKLEGEEIVSFCNTGHWAATNWFALSELAGLENVKLYPESMVGWVNNGGPAIAGQ